MSPILNLLSVRDKNKGIQFQPTGVKVKKYPNKWLATKQSHVSIRIAWLNEIARKDVAFEEGKIFIIFLSNHYSKLHEIRNKQKNVKKKQELAFEKIWSPCKIAYSHRWLSQQYL